MLLRTPRRRQQIHKKRKNVKSENQRYDPLQHGRHVLLGPEQRRCKRDGEANFYEDESEFGPEAEAQDAMLAEVDAQPLVFGADEDGADDVASHEEEEEAVVQAGVVDCVEY